MKITHRYKIPYDRDLYTQLKFLQKECAKVWNDSVEEAKMYYRVFKKWISLSGLQSNRKQAHSLHSQTIQAICDKYHDARTAAFEARKKGFKNQYPWRRKRFFCIPFKQAGFDVYSDHVHLKFSEDKTTLVTLATCSSKKVCQLISKDSSRTSNRVIIPKDKDLDLSGCTYLEIVWNKGYWVHYVMEKPEQENAHPFKVGGGDLGEIHSITVATEEKALVISGRQIRSVKQYRAKTLAELSKLISRCKKGSRQWKKYIRAKKRMMTKTENQIHYLLHKSTKEAIQFLVDENVTDFALGKVSGIEKNTKKNEKRKKKTTRTRRQQLSQWSYGKFTDYLKYKGKLHGIQVIQVNEAYTSQDCPLCGGRHHAEGRTFYCPVAQTGIHRDVNGAQNIGRKLAPMKVKGVEVMHYQPVWLKRKLSDYHRALTKYDAMNQKYRRRDGVVGTDLAHSSACAVV